MIFITAASIIFGICAWFFAMLSVDTWREHKRIFSVFFGLVSIVLGLGGILIWMLK